jgi:hypothetical protein
MKLEKLNSNVTHQIVDDNNTIIFQGTYNECLDYMTERFLHKIKTTPKLLDVFKRLADR